MALLTSSLHQGKLEISDRSKLLFAIEAGGAMAEVGLLPFARIALQVSQAVLPRYRSRFSKHLFNQPQLLAILCLMRYEDWTFREAEVRLGEHRELRQALGLTSVPDFTTLYRFLQRLDDQTIDRAVGETVRRSRGGRRDRLGARCSQHVFCAAHASSRAKAAAVAALVEVGGGSGFGSTVRVVADRAPRSVERLRQSARCGRNRRAANSHRPGLGRCRVRQRKESYLHPAAPRSTKRDPRQAWKENLASTWCPCGDAPGLSVSTLPATRSDRERILLGQTQALGARPWAKPVYASAPSSAARPEFQFVPPEASLPFSEDVNRAPALWGFLRLFREFGADSGRILERIGTYRSGVKREPPEVSAAIPRAVESLEAVGPADCANFVWRFPESSVALAFHSGWLRKRAEG